MAEGGIPGTEVLPDPTPDLPSVVPDPATAYSSASPPVPAAPDPGLLPVGALALRLQPPPQVWLLGVVIQQLIACVPTERALHASCGTCAIGLPLLP